MPKTLEARLRENTAQEAERRQRIATFTQQEEHLQQALQRIKEQHQAAVAEQKQALSAEDLYWSQMEANAQQLQERSEAMAGWKSTAARDEQLIGVYETNKDHPEIASSLKPAYDAALERKKAIEDLLPVEIALRMIVYMGEEAYLLSLPVPVGKKEGLAEGVRAHVEDVLEQNKVNRKTYRGHELQSYILLSINPKCHPEKLEELLNDLREAVPEALQEANVQWVVSDLRELVTEKKGNDILPAGENTAKGVPEGYIPATDSEVYEITGLKRSSLRPHLSLYGGPIEAQKVFDTAIGKDRIYVRKTSLSDFVEVRGKGPLLSRLRSKVPKGHVHISDPVVKELTGYQSVAAIYEFINEGTLQVTRKVSPGKKRGFLYLSLQSLRDFARSRGRAVPGDEELRRPYQTIEDVFGAVDEIPLRDAAALLDYNPSAFYTCKLIDAKGGPLKTRKDETATRNAQARYVNLSSLQDFAREQLGGGMVILYGLKEAAQLMREGLQAKGIAYRDGIDADFIQSLLQESGRGVTGKDGKLYVSSLVLDSMAVDEVARRKVGAWQEETFTIKEFAEIFGYGRERSVQDLCAKGRLRATVYMTDGKYCGDIPVTAVEQFLSENSFSRDGWYRVGKTKSSVAPAE
ncbi:hypothetical protein HYS49_02695 [Candidatus Woesearchaeota archaeon]|nr:hypothetical protein [Candidatus Woesearchaeota archaeon]